MALKDANTYLEAVRHGAAGDIQTTVRHLKILQVDAEHQLRNAARAFNMHTLETADAILRLFRAQIDQRHRVLQRTLRGMRLARWSRVLVRVAVGIGSFLLLYLLILLIHHPASEFAHGIVSGRVGAFAMLAALLLPVELIKALFIEPHVHHWQRRKARLDTNREFQKLIALAVRTRVAVSRVNA